MLNDKKSYVFRHELKYLITSGQKEIIAAKLGCFLEKDAHVKNGIYTIRSLYFDDRANSAYEEKLMGTAERRKAGHGGADRQRASQNNGHPSFHGMLSSLLPRVFYSSASPAARASTSFCWMSDGACSYLANSYAKVPLPPVIERSCVE